MVSVCVLTSIHVLPVLLVSMVPGALAVVYVLAVVPVSVVVQVSVAVHSLVLVQVLLVELVSLGNQIPADVQAAVQVLVVV